MDDFEKERKRIVNKEVVYRKGIRAAGVDYFIVSERLIPEIADCKVHNRIRTSDHWPMELILRV